MVVSTTACGGEVKGSVEIEEPGRMVTVRVTVMSVVTVVGRAETAALDFPAATVVVELDSGCLWDAVELTADAPFVETVLSVDREADADNDAGMFDAVVEFLEETAAPPALLDVAGLVLLLSAGGELLVEPSNNGGPGIV